MNSNNYHFEEAAYFIVQGVNESESESESNTVYFVTPGMEIL